jgi:hypothetical protein
MSGKAWTPERKAAQSRRMKERWKNPEYRAFFIAKVSGRHPKRKEVSEQNRRAWLIDRPKLLVSLAKGRAKRRHVGVFSRLERRAAKLLAPLGFTHHVKVAGHIFDFGRDNLLVEINGCFWHYHFCRHDDSAAAYRKRLKDWRNTLLAWQAGYRVLTLWECEESNWGKLCRVLI